MNTALLMKVGFQPLAHKESLWEGVLLDKYKCNNFANSSIKPGQQASSFWRALVQVKEGVLVGVKWALMKGDVVWFWEDDWVGDLGPLKC